MFKQQRPQPAQVDPSPLRADLDRAAAPAAEMLVQSVGGAWASAMRVAIRQQGWDLTALCSRGRLASLTDGELVVLMLAVVQRLDHVLEQPMDDVALPTLEEASAALRRALG